VTNNRLSVEGYETYNGNRWIKVSFQKKEAWVPIDHFVGSRTEAVQTLKRQKIAIIAPADVSDLLVKVSCLRDFKPAYIAENVGWNGNTFLLADGELFTPGNREVPHVACEIDPQKCASTGKLKTWKKKVAGQLDGQNLPVFAIMLAFVSPLLRFSDRVGNFGFEIVGRPGTGKSTVQYLMSSVLGGATQQQNGHYWVTCNTTRTATEQTMAVHSDLPIVLEEASHFMAGMSDRDRGRELEALVFQLSSGIPKARYKEPSTGEHRFVYLMSSNASLGSLTGNLTDTSMAAADRLITLPVPTGNDYHVFDWLPEGFAGGKNFADSLVTAANENHGLAIRRFLERLVKAKADDEPALRELIRKRVSRFVRNAKVDPNDGSAMRVAEAFGLTYAAGRLAQNYGALPKKLRCGSIAMRCYILHLNHSRLLPLQPNPDIFAKRLVEISEFSGTPYLPKGKVGKKLAKKIEAASAHVRDTRHGRELVIRKSKMKSLFPDWNELSRDPKVKKLQKREKGHATVWRAFPLRGKRKRVYCFILSDPADKS